MAADLSKFDLAKSELVVAVLGAGTMGRGIAQVCAQAGITTLLYDARDGAVAEAITLVGKGLDGQVAKGRMTEDDKRAVMRRLKPIASLDEAAFAGLAIEAIVEDIAVKRELFSALEQRMAAELSSSPIPHRCR